MQAFILALHVVICIVLIVIVLLQSGKEGMGVIFGGGSGSLFGGSGAGGLLTKVTALVATVFIVTSLSYTYLTRERTVEDTSIMDKAVQEQLETQQETPPAAGEPQGIQVDEGASGDAGQGTGIQVDTGEGAGEETREETGAAAGETTSDAAPATQNAAESNGQGQ